MRIRRIASRIALTVALLTSLSLATGCDKKSPDQGSQGAAASLEVVTAKPVPVTLSESDLGAFEALPKAFESAQNPITDEKVSLGRMLFFEPRISLSGTISCNSCHKLDNFGVDGEKTSEGHTKERGKRNSNTVYNAAGQFVQFWDGRAANVEEQAKGPVLNPVEMGMPSSGHVEKALAKIPEYLPAFKKAFPNDKKPLTWDNFAKAVGAFERKLVTPSRWDDFLSGNKSAITDDEKRGFKKFVETGCVTCHMGPLVGGSMYQKLGLVEAWPNATDLGRYEVTKQDADKMMFKVPSLRNIEKTAPYFHDGSVARLEDAVRLMARHQLGKRMSDEDVASIVTWLKALTGRIPGDYVAKPSAPIKQKS